MNPNRYLKLKKDELYAQLEEEGFYAATIDSIVDAVSEMNSKLAEVRHSKLLTERLINSFDRIQQIKTKDPNMTPRDKSCDRIYVEELLIRSLAQDKSYAYAYNIIAQKINRDEGQVFYPIWDITESEILELIDSENNTNNKIKRNSRTDEETPHFSLIAEKKLLNELFNHCTDILDSTKQEFINAVKTANFSDIKVKIKYKAQHLLYELSKIMGGDWYTKAVKSKNWSKPECSGHKSRLEYDKWRKQLDVIINTKPNKHI